MIWVDELKKRMTGSVLAGESMSNHTTFRIGGRCDAFAAPSGAEDLATALNFLRSENIYHIIIGQGSNVLFGDGGYRGCVLHVGRGMSRIVYEEDMVEAEAGTLLSKLVNETVARGLAGIESLAGIPGAVGGALFMNAGAFGQWISDTIESVDFIDGSGTARRADKNEIAFGYRRSAFQEYPERTIVSARFRLGGASKEILRNRVSEINRRRRKMQPSGYPSAGSFFKNPEGEPAGALIDKAGLKGLRVGGAEVSQIHANFIVNAGGATCADVVALAKEVRRRVQDACGITLEPEVRIIDGWD
jgi:UDP-N-acetylmuramate dehydrogenase